MPARFIALIDKQYGVEARAKEAGADIDERRRRRQEDAVPVLAAIEALLLANLHSTLRSSLLGKALHYLAAQWPKLQRFVEDGRYSLDNSLCENTIRPFVVGRRN